jgi:phosphate-selective porin
MAAAIAMAAASVAQAQTPAADATPQKPNGPTIEFKDHPTLRLGPLRLSFRARVQADAKESDAPFPDADDRSIDVARRRIGIEGRVADALEFQIERDLVDLDPWRDVFVNVRQFEFVQVQAGKFKLPFSLDENTGATNLDFAYRSLAATHLAPGRDLGIMVHGRLADEIVRYEIGRFDRDGRNARSSRNPDLVAGGPTIAGRVSVLPFRKAKGDIEDLMLGLAWAASDVPEGFRALQGETVLGANFYTSPYWVKGQRIRQGFELRWRPGPASIKAEYIRLTDERLDQSVEDSDLSRLVATGWYISGTYALTGDKKVDGLDAPKKPLFQGGIGAIEVALRIEQLTFGSEAKDDTPSASPRADVVIGNRNRVVTVGANWYANRWIKLQFNMIQETLADPLQGPAPALPRFWSRVFRFQFTL